MPTSPNPPEAPARAVAVPAAPGWRVLAFTYDLLPMIPLLMATSAIFLAINRGRTVEHSPLLAALEFASMWALVGLYFVLSWRRGGQTLGMRPWRLRVLGADGRPAATSALWIRFAVGCVTPLVGWLWCLVDAQRRALCDLAAGTVLVRMPPA